MKKTLFIGAAVCSVALFSCGKKDPVDTGIEKSNLGPAEAAQNWSKDMSEGRISSIWDSLPSSYQEDVSGLVTEFTNNTDEELYNESQSLVRALTGLLKNKKEIVLAITGKQIPDEKINSQIKEHYDAVTGLLNSIANSDAKTLSGLKSLDIEKFCGEIQPHMKSIMILAADADSDFKALSSMKSELISEDGDSAELKLSNNGKTENVNLVKVNDRWIPADLQKEWSKGIEEAKKGISQSGEMQDANKEDTIKLMKAVQEVIADLETASNEDEMMGKLMGASQKIGPMITALMMGGSR